MFFSNFEFSHADQASLTRDFNVTGGYACLEEVLRHDGEKIILPHSRLYEQASRAIGSKWKKSPLAIVYPSNTAEVSMVAGCAFQNGIPMTVSSGRHSFQGASIQNGYLVIDLSDSCAPPEIDSKRMMMSMSGGCLHADVIGALHKFQNSKSNPSGVMALIGAMPLVGYGGWSMGGGFGNLAPYVGIGCDQYQNVTVVLYNGTVVHANKEDRSELLWGLCGGGGGFGIVTEITIKLTVSPDTNHFTRLVISYPVKTLPEVLFRLQNALLSSKREIRFGAHGPTVTAQQDEDSMVQFFFLYLGSWQEAVSCMKELGLLSRELYPYPVKSLFGAPPQALIVNHSPRFAWGKLPSYANIIAVEYSSYPLVMAPMFLIDALAMNVTRVCQVIECFASLPNPMSKRAHTDLLDMAGNRSSLLYDAQESTSLNSPSNVYRNFHQPGQLINQLPLEAWKELVGIPGKLPAHGCTFTIPHVVGGKINAISPNETAYPWRNASIVFVGYGNEQQFCWEKFSKVISRFQKIQGYYNYLGHDISQNWEQLYFGENVQRIAKIRRLYDPYNFFTKPSVVSLGSVHIA